MASSTTKPVATVIVLGILCESYIHRSLCERDTLASSGEASAAIGTIGANQNPAEGGTPRREKRAPF